MSVVDIKSLNLSELNALKNRIEKAINRHSRMQKTQALKKLKAQAKSLGFSLDELIQAGDQKPGSKPGKKLAKKNAPLPPVYQDTANPEKTWSGRGRRPSWIEEGLKAGKKLDAFKIKPANKPRPAVSSANSSPGKKGTNKK